jgi:mRNA interferase MazF
VDLVSAVARFDVWLVRLDPSQGSEIRKTRPCLVVSPDEMNAWLRTVIVAPMTTASRDYPTRVPIRFGGKAGQVALDQLRAMDRERLVKKLGRAPQAAALAVCDALVEMFSA